MTLVKATIISITPVLIQRSLGDNVTIKFSLASDDPPVKTSNILWFHQTPGSVIDITNSTDDRHILSSDRLSFVIDGITHFDEGEYILQTTNEAGVRRFSVFLSITSNCILNIVSYS